MIDRPPRSRPSTPKASRRLRRALTLDNRYLPPLLITCILLVGQLGYGFLESYSRTLLAIACSIAMELILARLFVGKWPHLASAYITGISVGILIRSPAFWPYAPVQPDLDHVEVRDPLARPPPLEPVEPRRRAPCSSWPRPRWRRSASSGATRSGR